MKKKFLKNLFILFSFYFFFLIPVVYASGTASTGFSGNSSAYIGENIEITLYVGSVSGTTDDGGLAAFGGNLSYSSDKLELVSATSLAPFTIELVGNKFGGFGANTIKGYSNIMKFTFKTKALGTATVSYSGSSQPDANASPVSISGCSKIINITNPPSSNNNLSSLSVDKGSINFNKNNTSYSVSVNEDVTNININASAEDSGATISGTGSKSLNYGKNTFSIVVTAPNGDKKTYQIIVIRKDDRSSNNNLSNLTVNGGTLSPGFSSNTTNYHLSVPFSVENLSVRATPADNKSKVSIENQNNLVAEETTAVKITVTAENGSSKVYTINVTRGKDPSKVLSTNSYLANLTVSTGQLSPSFNKEQTKYIVYVPNEVEFIEINAEVEDTKYANLKKDGPEKLSVGNNQYKFTVTAEDNSTKEYIIVVYRGESVFEQKLSTNNYLKNIKIKNGKLTSKFDKKITNYTIVKNKNMKIEAIPDDENSTVSIIENNDVINILVKSASGEINVYTLIVKKTNITNIILVSFTMIILGIFLGYKFREKINNIFTKDKKIEKLKNKNNIL